jgi:hypothetical protein
MVKYKHHYFYVTVNVSSSAFRGHANNVFDLKNIVFWDITLCNLLTLGLQSKITSMELGTFCTHILKLFSLFFHGSINRLN